MPVGGNYDGLSRGVADDLARHNEHKYTRQTYITMFVHTQHKRLNVRMRIYIYIHMYICIHIFICIWQHKPVNIQMHIFMHTYMYTYICTGGDGNSHACCAADKAAQQNVHRLQASLMGALPGKPTSRAYMCVCIYLWIYLCTYIYLCMIYICTCICICTYIYLCV